MKLNVKIRPADLVLFALAIALVCFYVAVAGGGFPLDDSWIHQTYGRNLGALGQWSFIAGESSAASTSPLYTLILALGYSLNVDYRLWAHGLGALALAITGMLGMRIAEQFGLKSSPKLGIVAGLALVFAWHLLWAAGSGMETALFSMLTLALIYYAIQPTRYTAQHGLTFGILSALTTLARPEGVLLVGLCGLVMILQKPRENIAQKMVWLGTSLIGFCVLIAPYLIYNWQITGGVLPNTAAAKRSQAAVLFELPYTTRFINLLVPISAGGQVLLVPGVVMFIYRAVRERRFGYLLLPAWGLGLVALYAAWLPLDMQHGRYVIPALPALIVAGVIGTFMLIQAARRQLITRVLVNALAMSAAVLFVVLGVVLSSVYARDVAIIDGDMVQAAHWIDENLAQGELIAIHDIGAVGYFSPRPMLDIGGLISPEVIPVIRDGEALWELIEESGARYLMAYPYQTPNENANDPRLCPIYINENAVTALAGGSSLTIYAILPDINERDCLN